MSQQYTAAQLATLMTIFAKAGSGLIPGAWLTDHTVTSQQLDDAVNDAIALGVAAYGWGNHALVGYLLAESDPVFSASPAAGIAAADITNWDDAFGWGDHSSVGYLTAETDPVFLASVAAGITAGQVSNWDEAYSWGDHALAGYTSPPAGAATIVSWFTNGFFVSALAAEEEVIVTMASSGIAHRVKLVCIDMGPA